MIYKKYKPFKVEKQISDHYQSIGILEPSQIDLNTVCGSFNIILTYKPIRSFAIECDRFKMININTYLNENDQREQFFHELAHLLRHAGSQLVLNKAFIELQEFDAARFTKYAALPWHMLKNYPLDDQMIIKKVAYDFRVSDQLVMERLHGIKNNTLMRME